MTMIEPPFSEGMCMRQPAVEPLYDTRSEEDIFAGLSTRLGLVEAWHGLLNMAMGFDQKPELMLQGDRTYTDKEFAELKGKLWNDKDLDWYIEHGHSSTERQSRKAYRPWEGLRLNFYIEDLIVQRDNLKKAM